MKTKRRHIRWQRLVIGQGKLDLNKGPEPLVRASHLLVDRKRHWRPINACEFKVYYIPPPARAKARVPLLVTESCNFATCPLLHSSEIYFCLKKPVGYNKERYLGSGAEARQTLFHRHCSHFERAAWTPAGGWNNSFAGLKSLCISWAFGGLKRLGYMLALY